MAAAARNHPEFIVALTGGIGSGKTMVSDRLARLGAAIIDADLIAHELTAPDGNALDAIAAEFGPGVLATDGCLDRVQLRQLVFGNPSARRRLEAILHPRIRSEMLARLAVADGPYAVLVIPLLFETGQTEISNRILVVDLPEALQIARVKARSGLNEDEIRSILDSQASRSTRRAGADDLIDNSGSIVDLLAQTDALHQRYMELSGSGNS